MHVVGKAIVNWELHGGVLCAKWYNKIIGRRINILPSEPGEIHPIDNLYSRSSRPEVNHIECVIITRQLTINGGLFVPYYFAHRNPDCPHSASLPGITSPALIKLDLIDKIRDNYLCKITLENGLYVRVFKRRETLNENDSYQIRDWTSRDLIHNNSVSCYLRYYSAKDSRIIAVAMPARTRPKLFTLKPLSKRAP